jgi:O-antigen/teichoic acid export membrane protein
MMPLHSLTNRFLPKPGSLKARAAAAGSWVLFSFITANVLRISSNLILTRILTPDVFGIMAIASVFQVVIAMFTDLGLRPTIMQSINGEKASFLNTAWTVQIVRGGIIWFLCLALSAALHFAQMVNWIPSESAYAHPDLPLVLSAMSFSSVIFGFASTKIFSLSRKLDLKKVTQIELIQMTVGLVVAILLAWMTHSIWSFVVSTLAGASTSTLLSRYWLPGRNDRLGWDREALAEILKFGRWIFLSSAVSVFATNGDRLLLAAWLSPTFLGYYSIAASLTALMESTANRIFSSVWLPALSEIGREQPHRLREVYFRIRGFSDSAFVLAAGFLFATGQGIVDLLYDDRYAPAGEMLRLLSFGLLFSRYGLFQSVYIAKGRPNLMAIMNVAKATSLFVIVPASYWIFGMYGAIVGIGTYVAATLPLIFAFNSKLGLNSLKFELAMLGLWPFGWLFGKALLSIAAL